MNRDLEFLKLLALNQALIQMLNAIKQQDQKTSKEKIIANKVPH
jgi:hypothetical protein